MGYDLERFTSHVDEEFICTICAMVLENGVQLKKCEHMFCDECIKEWLSANNICPVDRKRITISQIKPIARAFNNLLLKLEIKCDFETLGCHAIVKLDSLPNHLKLCTFNPNIEKTCDKGCGLKMSANQYENHECMKMLAQLISNQQKEIVKFKAEFRSLISTQKWQNGKNSINDNNIIYFPSKNETSKRDFEYVIDNSQSLYPLTEINNYFEVKILDIGSKRTIVVGLTRNNYPSDELPGWDSGSIAYHGDDGMLYIRSSIIGTPFGPIWENGDVIGCGIRFPHDFDIEISDRVVVYFKRNNILIGERSVQIPFGGFFPTIGIRGSIGARVRVNFF